MELFDKVTVGHCNNEFTGVTVILSPDGFVAGCSVRGGAPGTRETALLADDKAMQRITALALCGGSAYGLEASCGVMQYLRDINLGYRVGSKIVPIVPSAVIYDLNDDSYRFPDKAMGYQACLNASNTLLGGKIGAGTGATVGKILGQGCAQSSGLGIHTIKLGDLIVTAIVVVNALGDIVDRQGNIIAGAYSNGAFIDTEGYILTHLSTPTAGENTTIGCIITNADITKCQANKLANISHNGLARAIRPVHTDYDGDTLFALSTATVNRYDFLALSVACVNAVQEAVLSVFKKN